jgi:SAM-dependent methyltransferase
LSIPRNTELGGGGENVLDVGSGVVLRIHYLKLFRQASYPFSICAGIGIEDLAPLHVKYTRIDFIQGDALSLPFADKSFDMAYSNAVIEHIFPLSARKPMVCEMLRVAKGVFLTTPNKWFPVEVHCSLPIVHWLPLKIHNLVLRWLGLERFSRGIYFDPMSVRDVRACFPSTAITTVELGILGMNIVAYYIEGMLPN